MFNEISLLIINERVYGITEGSPGGVDFDFFKAWELWKQEKFERLYMVHTHPDGFTGMSSIDVNMLQGWCKAFPIPIYFTVVTTVENGFSSHTWQAFYKDKKFICQPVGELEVETKGGEMLDFLLETSHSEFLLTPFCERHLEEYAKPLIVIFE